MTRLLPKRPDFLAKLRDLSIRKLQRVDQLEDRYRELSDCERIILDLWNRDHPTGLPCYVADCLLCRVPNIRHHASYTPHTLYGVDQPTGGDQ